MKTIKATWSHCQSVITSYLYPLCSFSKFSPKWLSQSISFFLKIISVTLSLSLSLSLFPQCYISLFLKVRYMFVSLLSPVSLSVLISQNISLFLINLSKFFHYFLPQCSHSLTVPIACLTYLSLC